jgi:hypothetical protein
MGDSSHGPASRTVVPAPRPPLKTTPTDKVRAADGFDGFDGSATASARKPDREYERLDGPCPHGLTPERIPGPSEFEHGGSGNPAVVELGLIEPDVREVP